MPRSRAAAAALATALACALLEATSASRSIAESPSTSASKAPAPAPSPPADGGKFQPQPLVPVSTDPSCLTLTFDELTWEGGNGTYFDDNSSNDWFSTWGLLDYGGIEWTNAQVKGDGSSVRPATTPVASAPNILVSWAATPIVAVSKSGLLYPRSVWAASQSFYPFSPALPPSTLRVTARRGETGFTECASAVLPPVPPRQAQFGPRVLVDLTGCGGADALAFGLGNRTAYSDSPRPQLEAEQYFALDSLELCGGKTKGGAVAPAGGGAEVPPAVVYLPNPPKGTVNRRRTRRRRQLLEERPSGGRTPPPLDAAVAAALLPVSAPAPAPPSTPGRRPPPPSSERCFVQGFGNVTYSRTSAATLAGDYYWSGWDALEVGDGLAWLNVDVVSDASPPPIAAGSGPLSSPSPSGGSNYGRPHWKSAVYSFSLDRGNAGLFAPQSVQVAALCDARDAPGGAPASDARCSPPGTAPPVFEVAGRSTLPGSKLRPCALATLGRAPADRGSARPVTVDLTACGTVDLLRFRLVPPVFGDQYSFGLDALRVCSVSSGNGNGNGGGGGGGKGGSFAPPASSKEGALRLPDVDPPSWKTAPVSFDNSNGNAAVASLGGGVGSLSDTGK